MTKRGGTVAIVLSIVALVALVALSGCDKLKSMAGGADGGASSSSPGLFGSVFEKDFQGEVSMKVTESKPKPSTMNLVVGIARPAYRVDISDPTGPKGGMILDSTTKKGWFLIPPQKMAMAIDLNQPMGGMMPGMPGGGTTPRGVPTAPTTPPTITKTGQTDTVAGYVCDIYNITTSDGRKANACLAENLTWFDVSQFAMQSPELAAAAAFADANHFPLRAIAYDAKGVEEMRMEATKIEKKTLAATEFAPPPDYKQINMAQMMQGMPGQPGGMPTHR